MDDGMLFGVVMLLLIWYFGEYVVMVYVEFDGRYEVGFFLFGCYVFMIVDYVMGWIWFCVV